MTRLPRRSRRTRSRRHRSPTRLHPTADPALPSVGSVLGKYELLSQVGRGSTSVVFEGRHRKLQIPVAVKVLHHDSAWRMPLTCSASWCPEAILLAKLNHPHVVRVWDLDDDGPAPYLVLEYVQGMTLAELIERKGPIPIPFAFAVIRQAVEGLADAHKLGIVHRDVKPGNLLIGRDGVVKVADLGLAMIVGDLLTRRATGHGASLPAGTAAYLAPEQARDPSQVDFRADVYSLGATLYHAVTGRYLFDGETPMQVITKHLQEPPVNPRQYVPDLSDEAADLILRMLAKEPRYRVGSYDELRVALARAVGDRRAPRPLAESFLGVRGAQKFVTATTVGREPQTSATFSFPTCQRRVTFKSARRPYTRIDRSSTSRPPPGSGFSPSAQEVRHGQSDRRPELAPEWADLLDALAFARDRFSDWGGSGILAGPTAESLAAAYGKRRDQLAADAAAGAAPPADLYLPPPESAADTRRCAYARDSARAWRFWKFLAHEIRRLETAGQTVTGRLPRLSRRSPGADQFPAQTARAAAVVGHAAARRPDRRWCWPSQSRGGP